MASEHLKLTIHTSDHSGDNPSGPTPRRTRIRTRLSFQERLLRNSCLACAVLLGVLALSNLNQPWAVKAADSIQQALTMTIDLDESLGQLTFVRKLMPESALVFFDLQGGSELARPVKTNIRHAYTETQPWLMFEPGEETSVCAVEAGVVSAVSPLSDGSFGLLIDHGNGLESVMANLDEVHLSAGDEVIRGAVVGSCSNGLYFELRQGGEPVDPSQKLGL